jgi:hypothetical protein
MKYRRTRPKTRGQFAIAWGSSPGSTLALVEVTPQACESAQVTAERMSWVVLLVSKEP